jgi:TolB-like protein
MLEIMLYRFEGFEYDVALGCLRHGSAEIRAEPQVGSLLALLLSHRDRIVVKDELIDAVFGGRAISDATISSRIRSLRKLLGDDARSQRFIRTVHGRGFRFVAPTERVERSVTCDTGSQQGAGRETPVGRPSIAILPFRHLGARQHHPGLSHALAHDLIAALCRLRWLRVTARGSSFRVGGLDPSEAARQLAVRYILTGVVESAHRRLVVAVELTDCSSGEVIWVDRFAGSPDDMFAIREAMTARVPAALDLRIPLHEAAQARRSGTEQIDAWFAFHLGLQHMHRLNASDGQTAGDLFRRAITLDPGFARAHAGLSFVHFQNAFLQESGDRAQETDCARRHAEQAVHLDPLDPFANFAMGRTFWLGGDLDTSADWLRRSTSLSPSFAQGIYALAWNETVAGNGLAGREHVDLAMQLSPLDPMHYAMLGVRALTHLAAGEDAEGSMWAERAARTPGAHAMISLVAAIATALAGNGLAARHWATHARRRSPSISRNAFLKAFPIRNLRFLRRVTDCLTKMNF